MSDIQKNGFSLKQFWRGLPNALRVVFIAFGVSILYLLPHLLASDGALYGDDLHFHLDRARGLSNIWSSPVNFTSFYKVGQGVNFFYPYLTFYPFYLFYANSHNFYDSWMLYLYGLTVIGYIIAYYSARGITQNSRSGHFFALLYIFATYRFVNHGVRFAAGELIATTFLPLVFYGLYLILKGQSKKWYYLTFGIVLVLYSHLLSFVMTIGFVVLFFLIGIIFSDNRLKRTRDFVLAGVSAFILSSFQLLPMLEQLQYHKFLTPGKFSEDLDAKYFKDIINLALNDNVRQHTFGLMVLIAFIVSIFFIRKFNKLDYLLLAISLGLVLIETPSFVVKPFETIQFIWRFNAYITLFILFLAAKFLGTIRLKKMITFGLLLILLMINHTSLVIKTYNGSTAFPANPVGELSKRNNFKKLTNSIILMDYANVSSNKKREIYDADSKVNHRVFYQNTSEELMSKPKFTNNSASFQIFNPTLDTQIIELPLYHYKGQYATVDGVESPTIVSRESGSTMIHLPPGEHEVVVTYHYTILAKISFISGILAFIAILAYIFEERYTGISRLMNYIDKKRNQIPSSNLMPSH